MTVRVFYFIAVHALSNYRMSVWPVAMLTNLHLSVVCARYVCTRDAKQQAVIRCSVYLALMSWGPHYTETSPNWTECTKWLWIYLPLCRLCLNCCSNCRLFKDCNHILIALIRNWWIGMGKKVFFSKPSCYPFRASHRHYSSVIMLLTSWETWTNNKQFQPLLVYTYFSQFMFK